MIIFDLDGTLADCEHRRHYEDPALEDDACFEYDEVDSHGVPLPGTETLGNWCWSNGKRWKPDWKRFFEECDKDSLIDPVVKVFIYLGKNVYENDIEIWSGRCESVRHKTILWFRDKIPEVDYINKILKMRPVGDYTPDHELKERWLKEYIEKGYTIDYVFDDRKKVCDMWRKNGIFVFDCNQTGKEF